MTKNDFFNSTAYSYGITPDQLRSPNYKAHIREATRARYRELEALFPNAYMPWMRISDFRPADLARGHCEQEMEKAPPTYRGDKRWTIARMGQLRQMVEAGMTGRTICAELGFDYDRDMKTVSSRIASMVRSGDMRSGRLGYPRNPADPSDRPPDKRGLRDRNENGQFMRRYMQKVRIQVNV